MVITRKNKDGKSDVRIDTQISEGMDLFFSKRKTVRQCCAPGGVNPNPLDYMVIDDGGRQIFTMCFYIDVLPIRTTFASTFARLFNFPDVTSCVFIDPMVDGKSSKQLDKRINMLGTEQAEAAKDDRNRWRKITQKLNKTEAFAVDVESGDNMLYEVAFLFILQSVSLEGLHLMVNDFHSAGKEKGIELSACYSVHPEAFISGYPTNRIFKAKSGLLSSSVIKKHVFDQKSLGDIFNHTRGGFSNENGIIAGHNMYTNEPYLFDPYDDSHDGYGIIFTGKTHSGKSTTVKLYASRLVDFDYVIRSIDFNPVGIHGEYTNACIRSGGDSFQITPDSGNVLNIFELDVELDYDTNAEKEFPALHLAEKKSNLRHLIMTMIKDGRDINEFSQAVFIDSIVENVIDRVYEKRGIYDGDPDSLFEDGEVFQGGKLIKGKVRKLLPELKEFYYEVLKDQRNNTEEMYDVSYAVVVKSLKKYIRELDYCPKCLRRFSGISSKKNCECSNCKEKIISIRGTRPYFDGQSTIHTSLDIPWINYDISTLPDSDRRIALLVCMEFTKENDVKKNSANPTKAKKMVEIIDEVHKTFEFEEARKFIEAEYREYRKRNVSPWTCTQALADYKGYKETEAIVKNAACIFLLKQAVQDREYLKKTVHLTDSQIDEVFRLGGTDEYTEEKRRGEMCVIDGERSQFVKVDYLEETEAWIAETDMKKLKKLYGEKAGELIAAC